MTPERLARIKQVLNTRQPDLSVLTDQVHNPSKPAPLEREQPSRNQLARYTSQARSARGAVALFCRKKMSERSELLFPEEKSHRTAGPTPLFREGES
tara:strand:+ start:1063 stop:1353 length:291 start_codon:yes stop_codon:yes gene_type:complete